MLQTRLCSTVAKAGAATPPSRSQLFRLAVGVGVPMVGFGIADNAIMIVAGDHIDATLGVRFGFSTLAAAGLGNLLSDVCGISLGEVIEGWCVHLGLEAPALTVEQAAMRTTRMTKWGAGALGITIGCLIGMLPLLFMQDRKQVYFTDDDLALFQRQFAPYGVSADQFFALMQTGLWHTAEPGTMLVRQGETLDRVLLIHSGVAESYMRLPDGTKDNICLYTGRGAADGKDSIEERHGGSGPVDSIVRRAAQLGQIRGCIIGGTALVEPDVLQKPYPNQVVVHDTMRYVSWSTEELREAMQTDKSIESAVYSTLYLDLVEGLRKQRKSNRSRSGANGATDARSTAQAEYAVMMHAVVADGLVRTKGPYVLRLPLVRTLSPLHRTSLEPCALRPAS